MSVILLFKGSYLCILNIYQLYTYKFYGNQLGSNFVVCLTGLKTTGLKTMRLMIQNGAI